MLSNQVMLPSKVSDDVVVLDMVSEIFFKPVGKIVLNLHQSGNQCLLIIYSIQDFKDCFDMKIDIVVYFFHFLLM